jgi:four helix bundle protein
MIAPDPATFGEEMRRRTKQFALRVLALTRRLPNTDEARVIGRQLLRSGTSVGANFRAVTRSRSSGEFVSSMKVVIEETDETLFWLEILVEGGIVDAATCAELLQTGKELVSILAAGQRTARRRVRRSA